MSHGWTGSEATTGNASFWPFLQTSLILFIVNFKHLKINDWYVYPDWAYALGWMMTISSVIMVPLWAVFQMCWTAGTFREVCLAPIQLLISWFEWPHIKDHVLFCTCPADYGNDFVLFVPASVCALSAQWRSSQAEENDWRRGNECCTDSWRDTLASSAGAFQL